ncbi:39S ribosomal protein L38 [Paragonimus kellicotti]|nr:39S ribosomal protein L38 [Paragonimus kellicotti]
MGNLITPELAMMPPSVDLSSASPDYLWTLVMSCPDEPFGDEDCLLPTNEYVHWMVDLRTQRSFHTREFYRHLESQLTPAGLAFFQSSWDESVRMYFRNVLDIPEPIFEVQWPTPRLPPQERYPVANSWNKTRRHPHGLPLIRERYGVHNDVSFDVYLDRYRDRKELNEELIRERLRNEGNPLDPDEPRRMKLEYPAAVPMPKNMPSWWMKQETQRRLRRGRWRHLEGHDG